MMQALQNGASGMAVQQKRVDTIANNIANINTTGYKKSRVSFKDALYLSLINPVNVNNSENLRQGCGVLMDKIAGTESQGCYIKTDEPLDLAIAGEGFFAVQDENNQMYFTRDGSFKAMEKEGGCFLATSADFYVLDEKGQPIRLYGNVSEIAIGSDGGISFSNGEEPGFRIGVFSFINNGGLGRLGGNLLFETESSGPAVLMEPAQVNQRALEGSNVDLADEMTQLIKAQRAYQIASKVVTTADEMEAMANNMGA